MKQPALRHLLVLLIGVAAAVIPINILAAPGDIYVPVFNTGEIWSVRLNPVSLAFKITGLNGPRGLAFDGSGNLFEADQSSGTIYKITAPNIKTVFAAGLSGQRHRHESTGENSHRDAASWVPFHFLLNDRYALLSYR